jgi:glycosyl transferase family 25
MVRSGGVDATKVLVLTLRQSEDRQARIKQALDEAGIGFEFFWGIDGRKYSHPLLDLYDEPKRLKAKGDPMTPGLFCQSF